MNRNTGIERALMYCQIIFLILANGMSASAQTMDSLDFKIGQMIMIGMPKAEVDSAVLREVRTGKAGAVIFFEKNIPKSNSFAGLKKIAWTYQKAAPTFLFIGIDQEGGKVNRLKEKYGFPRSITARAMGKSRTLDSVRFYGQSTAATLAGLGINVNFAPVVDLAVNPNNTVIVKVERSFSSSEDTVVVMAREFIKQHRRSGVVTVLKHFPGHGSSKEDTHFGIADVTKTWNERELKPYQSLLDSGSVDAIMTAHIVNKKLDKRGYPGTLSDKVMDSLLRKKMGYQGVIFSDDMQMHAITKEYGLEESIRLAINAGVDILCFSNNIQNSEERTVDKVHSIIRGFVEKGAIGKERIDESYRRISKLKLKISSPECESDNIRKQLATDKAEIETLKAKIAEMENHEPVKVEKPSEEIKEPIREQPTRKKRKR